MKLRRSSKRLLGMIALVVYFSGVLLYFLSGWVRVASPVGEQHHPLEYWTRVSHTAFTYIAMLAMGYLVHGHVIPGLRARAKKRLKSGKTNLVVFAILVGTALVIFYAGENDFRLWSTRVHSFLGLASPLALILHIRGRSRLT